MRNPKNVFLKNILSIDECKILESNYLNFIDSGWKGYDHDSRTNSISISDPYYALSINGDDTIQRITKCIETNYNESVVYSHAYLRMYRNQSKLAMHTDRKGLDITLSVNVGGIESWPMFISNVYTESDIDTYSSRKQNDDSKFTINHSVFLTPLGCGVVCYGNNFPHWRDKLECEDDEYVLQIFYHWRINN